MQLKTSKFSFNDTIPFTCKIKDFKIQLSIINFMFSSIHVHENYTFLESTKHQINPHEQNGIHKVKLTEKISIIPYQKGK